MIREENNKTVNVKNNEILIFPFQRICRTLLLLETLSKNTPNDYPDFEYLNKAIVQLKGMINVGNYAKGVFDQLSAVNDIYEKFIGIRF